MSDFETCLDLLPFGFDNLSVMDPVIMSFYKAVKKEFPKCWVNAKNGVRVNNWCGYRTQDCKIGATKSAHKVGKALDLHDNDLNKLRDWVISNGKSFGITRTECSTATPTWVHVDTVPLTEEQKTRLYQFKEGIYIFKP